MLNGALAVDVDNDVQPTITAEYFIADNLGIELLAATPFKHNIALTTADGAEVPAQTKHLPPTLSLQYHFANSSKVTPFVGVGLNYTTFFQEKIAIDGADLEIEDSFGIAGHVGMDVALTDNDALRADARYISLKPDVKLNGDKIGSVKINPWVFGVSYVHTF